MMPINCIHLGVLPLTKVYVLARFKPSTPLTLAHMCIQTS